MTESGRLQDRIVIVTGATSGIGHAVAERCIGEGAVVVATGRRAGALQELQAAHGDRLIPAPAFALTSAAAAAMAGGGGGGGSIVLVGSQLAHVGIAGYETYTAAKGGVTAMARSFAAEAGPRGVRVNVLAPGVVRTPMAYVNRQNFDDLEAGIAGLHPLRRIGVPGDLAGPAVFLLSDDAAWVTGQTLIVDGGFTAV